LICTRAVAVYSGVASSVATSATTTAAAMIPATRKRFSQTIAPIRCSDDGPRASSLPASSVNSGWKRTDSVILVKNSIPRQNYERRRKQIYKWLDKRQYAPRLRFTHDDLVIRIDLWIGVVSKPD